MLKPSDPIDDSLSIGGNAESQLIDFWQFAPSAPSLVNVSIETTSSGLGAAFTQLNIGATTGDECFFVDSGSCTASISFNPALGLSLSLNLGVTAQCLV